MKKTIFFIKFSLCLFLFSCKNLNEHSLGKNISEVGFKMVQSNEATLGSEVCTSLYFQNSEYKIIKAYYNCDNYTPKEVDEAKGIINCCSKKLYMEGDTVKVCLVPGDLGLYQFHKIKLLFKDESNNYFVADTTFSFNVKDSIH